MNFDKGVSDILVTIGSALQKHLNDINNQQKLYVETYNAVMKIPVVQELLNENESLKQKISEIQSVKSESNISLKLKILTILQTNQVWNICLVKTNQIHTIHKLR